MILKKEFKRGILFFVFLFIVIAAFSSMVYTPPKELYQEETKNYRFVFEKDLYYFYSEIKDYAEELYAKYMYFYGSNPGKITVFILDDVDFTNSFANTSTNVIRLYINPPNDFMALGGNVEDWSRFVFSHELTHIFYGSDVRDPLISWIPNQLIKNSINMIHQPSYLHEGLSIYMESKEFDGRFEDDLFNMYLRSEILSNEFPRYYLGSGSQIDTWSPAGFNYMYGTILVREIVNNYGEMALRQMVRVLNTSVFTNIDEAFYWVTGKSWNRFLYDVKQKYLEEYDILTNKGYKMSWMKVDDTYKDTGNLRTDGDSLYGYFLMPDKPKGIYKDYELLKKSVNSFDVNSNGDLLYLVTTYNTGFYTNKLYFECSCRTGEQLIDERVTSFGFLSDNKVAYSKLENGLTAFYVYDLNTQEKEKLIDYGKYVVNEITGNQDIIYFSANYKNQTDIYSFDLNTHRLYQITNDSVKELGLFVYDDYIYYSANYKDGIYNIYRLNIETQQADQLTSYLSGAFNPVLIEDKLYHLVYSHEGFHLSFIDTDQNVIDSFALNNKVQQTDFEKFEIFYPDNKQIDRYVFEKPYFVPFPLILADQDDNVLLGAGVFFMSEAMNYSGFVDGLSDGENFYGDLFLSFDYFTTNSIGLSFDGENLSSSFSISDSYTWYLGNYINSALGLEIAFENTSFDYYGLQGIFQYGPYAVNNYNIYELGTGISYYSNSGLVAYVDKPFVVFNSKINPYVGYQEKSIYLGSSIDRVLWRPYVSFEAGKYRFDGIVAGADVNYNFGKEEFDYLIYIQFDFSLFYWLNLPLAITSDMFGIK
ncbi:hypothetical protein PW5551_04415 [Petrotoga sp. 9PW.55.5.1]|uniref:TolB family protein n=1 Tax=Petrotoga sp. 9PW.55.5.1 TaxID=1308979 RepID=UPI000DC48887|nr:hypothetical protein [Petrotoga sp. 9PW.55.5.1]RAO99384.1 hypothetical protein PW5551_04415 [Petrotoga sp. 9PW.55.5.1]